MSEHDDILREKRRRRRRLQELWYFTRPRRRYSGFSHAEAGAGVGNLLLEDGFGSSLLLEDGNVLILE